MIIIRMLLLKSTSYFFETELNYIFYIILYGKKTSAVVGYSLLKMEDFTDDLWFTVFYRGIYRHFLQGTHQAHVVKINRCRSLVFSHAVV